MKNKLDLIALSKQASESCFIIEKDGSKTPDFKRLTIRVELAEGKTKVYHIKRHRPNMHMADPNMIDTYTTFPNDPWGYDRDRTKKTKWYTADGLDKKLVALAREIRNKEYTIEYGY